MADVYVTGGGDFHRAVDNLILQVEDATRQALADGAALIQRQAMQNSSGRPGPNVRTGAHRRGIVVDGPKRVGASAWSALIYPTMVYSRALELGHPRWESGVKYPYLEPAVMQVGPKLEPLFERAWSSVIRRAA